MTGWSNLWGYKNKAGQNVTKRVCGNICMRLVGRGFGGKCVLKPGHGGDHQDYRGQKWFSVEADK